ncbi:hypothetical protein [Lautropia mirabilis]
MMEHLSERSLREAMMALPATPDIELELPDRTLDGSADRIPDFLDETHLLRPVNDSNTWHLYRRRRPDQDAQNSPGVLTTRRQSRNPDKPPTRTVRHAARPWAANITKGGIPETAG